MLLIFILSLAHSTIEFSAFMSSYGIRGIKYSRACCYRKIIHLEVVTVTLLHAKPHHSVVDYFPITTCPVM